MNLFSIKHFFYLALFASCSCAHAQESLYISEGERVYSKNTLITIKGMDFYNEGAFRQDSSTLLFVSREGNSDRKIAGEGEYSLSKLKIDIGNRTLLMGNNLKIAQEVKLVEGNVDLNSHSLFLGKGSAQIVGEEGENRILGEGIIEKETILAHGHVSQLGNLGLDLQVHENLGNTLIRRIQRKAQADTLELILRQYEIETSFIPQSPVHLSLSYLDTENPFGKESALVPVELAGESWNRMSYFQSESASNTMNITLAEAKQSWRIGLSDSEIGGSFTEKKILNDFQLYPNPFDGFLLLQWEEAEEKPVQVQVYSSTGAILYEKNLEFHSQEILLSDIPDLSEGVYTVKIITDKGNTASRSLIHKK